MSCGLRLCLLLSSIVHDPWSDSDCREVVRLLQLKCVPRPMIQTISGAKERAVSDTQVKRCHGDGRTPSPNRRNGQSQFLYEKWNAFPGRDCISVSSRMGVDRLSVLRGGGRLGPVGNVTHCSAMRPTQKFAERREESLSVQNQEEAQQSMRGAATAGVTP